MLKKKKFITVVKPKKKNVKNKAVFKKSLKKKVGKITHYFSDIKVAVIKLSAPLKVGDNIRVTGGENTDFSQEIKSMQLTHEKIKLGKKGNSIGVKIDEKVREGYNVYKI